MIIYFSLVKIVILANKLNEGKADRMQLAAPEKMTLNSDTDRSDHPQCRPTWSPVCYKAHLCDGPFCCRHLLPTLAHEMHGGQELSIPRLQLHTSARK